MAHPEDMRVRLDRWLDFLRTGFWFVSLVMLILASALAVVLLFVDERFDPGIRRRFRGLIPVARGAPALF
jgi:hypothetical protein